MYYVLYIIHMRGGSPPQQPHVHMVNGRLVILHRMHFKEMFELFTTAPGSVPHINDWDVSGLEDMSYLFYDNEHFNEPLDKWDVSNVTNMNHMFADCPMFNQSLNHWNTSRVVDMSGMFETCLEFNQPLDTWNVRHVTNMSEMFSKCTSFNQSLNNWNVGNVVYMTMMFESCIQFNQPLNNWNVRHVEIMAEMFSGCVQFNQPLNKWDVNWVYDFRMMFLNCATFNQPLNEWNMDVDVSTSGNVTNMFKGSAMAFENIPNVMRDNNTEADIAYYIMDDPYAVDILPPEPGRIALLAAPDSSSAASAAAASLSSMPMRRSSARLAARRTGSTAAAVAAPEKKAEKTVHPRIDLFVASHGGEVYDAPLPPNYLDGTVTMFNCGGDCGSRTYISNSFVTGCKHKLADLIVHQNNPNTFDVMEKFRASQKAPYKAFASAVRSSDEPPIADDDAQCKIYHPQTDKMYHLSIDFLEKSEISIIQMRDIPRDSALWALTGMNVYDDAVLDYIQKHSHDPETIQAINFLRQRIPEYPVVFLNEIILICRTLGFEYINIYDLSCRVCDDIPPERLEELNRIEKDVTKRKAARLGGRHTRGIKRHRQSRRRSRSRKTAATSQRRRRTMHART